ncbi:MAG: XdhC family protein [Blautia wexlerae]
MPAEIAVSIAAEIVREKINIRSYVDETVEQAVREKKGVMMTIIFKSGSSPRGTGSKMFLDQEGRSYGSVGGGNVRISGIKART